MRIIDALRRSSKRARRNDPVFGSLLYMGDRLGYWEGKAMFAATSAVVEVFVDGSPEDDLQQQREFFARVGQEWPILSEAIGRMLLERLFEQQPWPSDGSAWDRFRVSSLSIPKASLEDADWEISLAANSETNQLWTVHLKGRKPQHVMLDD